MSPLAYRSGRLPPPANRQRAAARQLQMLRLPLLAVLVCLALPHVASAYVCTRASAEGPSLAWENRQVVLRYPQKSGVEVSLAQIQESLLAAAAEWGAPACSDFQFLVGASTDEERVGFDWRRGTDSAANQNILVFRRGAAFGEDDAWLHPRGAIAITTLAYTRTTGTILDADIEMNDAYFSFTACEEDALACTDLHDLHNTLTHELGHVVGLGHPPSSQPGASEASMFSSTSIGDRKKRDLAEDDVAGLCEIYPSGEAAGECYSGIRPEMNVFEVKRSGCSGVHAESGSVWAWGLACCAGLCAGRRRRQRRLLTSVDDGKESVVIC